MKINKSMILIFTILFVLLIGLTTINATTDNTTTTTITDTQNTNIQTQTDTINTPKTTVKTTTNTTQTTIKDNTNIKESSTDNENINNIETTNTNNHIQNTQTNTQNNKETNDNTNNNNQNTNIQITNTINKEQDNNLIKTTNNLKTSIKTTAPTTTYNWYVSTDGADSDSSSYSNPTNLAYALTKVQTGQSIFIKDGTYNITTTIIIDKNLNITGESTTGTILSGQNGENTYTQIMTINKGYNINITNITFTNGNAKQGGTINNQGTLTITDASFINNIATTREYDKARGGAISNNGTCTITNTSFINNTATGRSSIKEVDGGAISNTGTLTITNASFINNTVTNDIIMVFVYGGAIENEGKLTVTGSTFINNTAKTNRGYAFGGAISNNGTLTANYNIFINNTDTNRYDIYNNETSGVISSLDYNWWGQNTTNYQKSPDKTSLIRTNYKGEKLTKWLYLNMTSTTNRWTVNNPITLTTNLTGYYDNSTSKTGTLTITEAQKIPQNIVVTYTTNIGKITDNTLLINGISTATFTPTIQETTYITSTVYSKSTTLSHIILDTVYVNTTAQGTGTGESWINAVGSITDALDRVSDGGKIILAEGIYNVVGDYALTIAQNVNITGQTQDKVIIDGLKANQIMTINKGYNVNITNITFTNGNATNGGAINNNGNCTVTNTSFINNTATDIGQGGYAEVDGGAINNNGNCTVTNTSFINNTATSTSNGEGSYAAAYGGSIYNNGNCTVTNTIFINNSATAITIANKELGSVYAYGGAIYNYYGSTCSVTNTIFINNSATATGFDSTVYAYGGAICNFKGTGTVTDASFINNTAMTTATGGTSSSRAYGGAIYNDNTCSIMGSSFINNSVTSTGEGSSLDAYGGAIYNEATLSANYNIFLNNIDRNNYAIYNDFTINSLDYNWWGQNTTNYKNNPDFNDLKLTNYDSINNWLYLNMTSTTDTEAVGSPVTLTTNLTGYSTGTTTGTLTTEETQKLPQNIPVTYTTNQGTITGNTSLINGISTATYTPTTEGTNTITSTIYTNNTSITNTANRVGTTITMNNVNGTTKENITIIAIVTSNGNTVNTGTVTFTDTNGLSKTVSVNNGIATINTIYTKPGNYTITATYNENNIYTSSQTTATATIKTRDVNMNITVTPSTTTGNTTFNTIIKDTDGNNVTDGTIYFYNNNTLLGNTTVTNGTATYNYTFNKAGNYNITAVYNSTLYNSVNKTVQFTITKSNTTTVVNPITGTVQNTITLQANITDQYGNNVTSGKVVFKINGTTIKDTQGNAIYANVTNGIATLQYTIPTSLTKNNLTIQAIYLGTNDTYNPSQNNNTINVTKRTADINLIITKNPVKATDTVTFMTIVRDSNGTIISNGQVVFKFNGKTIKDTNGNPILVNVTNGQATLKYTIPNGISAKTYNITAVYANNDYNRAETNAPLTAEKIASTITLNPTNTNRGSNITLITGIIKDTNGNLMVGTHKIAVKLNGKSIGTYTTTNGTINTNITIPNTLKNTNYTITVKIGDTNGYYGTNATTTLTINNLKTFKQKVSI